MKKTLYIFLTLLSIAIICSPKVLAQTASDESETKTDDEVIQEGQERLKKAVKGISTDDQRGFIGTVKRVSEEALTVETRKGTQIITLSSEVSVVQDNKAFKVSNIEIDSQVVVMGYQKGEDFTPKRILVLKKPLQTVKKTIWVGSVKKIDKQSVVLTTRGGEEKTFSIPSKPAPLIEDNSGTTLKLADVEVDQDVLILTVPEDSSTQSIKDSSGKIVRIHSLAVAEATPISKEEPTATPKSGKATATPKASATKKPTATPKEE